MPVIDHELINDTDISFLKNKLTGSELSVSELGATVWTSATTFRNSDKRGKHFVKVFHTSPGRWMKQQKAKAIFHELKYGKQPVKAIGLDYGFCSPSHFTNYCKKHFGISPCELRKRM